MAIVYINDFLSLNDKKTYRETHINGSYNYLAKLNLVWNVHTMECFAIKKKHTHRSSSSQDLP